MDKKLKIKDIIMVSLLSICNILVFSIGTFLMLTPFTILLTPIVYALLEAIVFYVIGVKVKKKGAYLIYSIIHGVIGFYLPYIILYVMAGIIAEFILKNRGYGNLKAIGLAYVITQLLASIGAQVYPFVFAYNSIIKRGTDPNMIKNIEEVSRILSSFGLAVFMILIILSSITGALIGERVIKKHILEKSVK